MRHWIFGIAVVGVFIGAGQASAVVLQFFGEDLAPGGTVPAGGNAITARNQFLSNLVGVGTEDFEGFAGGTSSPIVANFGVDTATISAGVTVNGGPSYGLFATSGTKYIDNQFTQYSVTFNNPQAAFGFYGTDIGDVAGQLTLTLVGGGNVTPIPHTVSGPNSTLLYFGAIGTTAADQFTSVQFSATASDRFGFDDMTIGRLSQVEPNLIVPEPSAFLIWALGLLGLAAYARKRRE